MKIFTNEDVTKLNPMAIRKIDHLFGEAIKHYFNNNVPDLGYYYGTEFGCGAGRRVFKLATCFKMRCFEGNEFLAKRPVVSNFTTHWCDITKESMDEYKNSFNVVLIDDFELTKENKESMFEKVNKITKDKAWVFLTGSKENVTKWLDIDGFNINQKMTEDIIETGKKEYTKDISLKDINFTVLEKGFDLMNKIKKDNGIENFESDVEETKDVDQILEDGGSVTLDENIIRSAKSKKELKTFFEALNIENKYDQKLSIKDLKKIILENI